MFLFAKMELTDLFLVAGIALVTAWMLGRSRRFFRRSRSSDPIVHTERPAAKTPGIPVDAPPELLRWEVHMQETARELSAQLDNKMRALQTLVAEADRAALRLEQARAKTQATETRQTVVKLPREGVQTPEAAGRSSEETKNSSPALTDEAIKEEAYILSDYGFTPLDIASRVGTSVDEVRRILAERLS